MVNRKLSKRFTRSLVTGAVATALAMSAAANADDTEIKFGGYVKLDTMISDYADGPAPSSDNIGRQIYIPSLTPIGGEGDDPVIDFHARQSRFFLDTKTMLDNGETLGAHIEMDFMLTPQGDQRISNSYNPRLRHAYITYGNWLFGQTWSNFQDTSILAESVDFIGITDGIVFNRQAQIRYTQGGFSVSVETPETTVTPYGGGGRITSSDGYIPDVVVKYKGAKEDLTYSFAAIVRQLAYDVSQTGNDETTTGYGVTIGLKYQLGMDDLRVSGTTGSGLGRYLGLNTFNGAVIDGNGGLEAIDSTGVSLAYRHFWNDKVRSNFVYSRGWADNDIDLTGAAVTEFTERYGVNLMYSPTKSLTFGAEISQAHRENEAGIGGDLNRLQLMAMYKF